MSNSLELQAELDLAISQANVFQILHLLEHQNQLDLNQRDVSHDLETPLMRMCHIPSTEQELSSLVAKLQACAWNANIQDVMGRTLIMHACIAGKTEILRMALNNGCDVSLVDKDDNSAVIYAVRSGNDENLQLILENENCVSLMHITNKMGHTPLDVARLEGKRKMAERLAEVSVSRRKVKSKIQKVNLVLTPRTLQDGNGFLSPVPGDDTSNCSPRKSERLTVLVDNGPKMMDNQNCSHRMTFWREPALLDPNEQQTGLVQTPKIVLTTFHKGEDALKDQDKPLCQDGQSTATEKRSPCRLLKREWQKPVPESKLQNGKQLQRCRKDSLSLPDLRDFSGKLVTSGERSSSYSEALENELTKVHEAEEDGLTEGQGHHEKANHSVTGSSVCLPPIPTSTCTMDHTSYPNRTNEPNFARSRKQSSSEEILYRSLVL